MNLPNLAGIATSDLVEKIGGGSFSASYINWSRTLNLLRTHAPGWLPEVVQSEDGGILHSAPIGCYLMIRFRNGDHVTPAVPQAVMDQRNSAIHREKITARDITDTHRRGICMAAAMLFGLAYELWAKIPLESGYTPEQPSEKSADLSIRPTDGAMDSLDAGVKEYMHELADRLKNQWVLDGASVCLDIILAEGLDETQTVALWSLLPSDLRRALKIEKKEREDVAKTLGGPTG